MFIFTLFGRERIQTVQDIKCPSPWGNSKRTGLSVPLDQNAKFVDCLTKLLGPNRPDSPGSFHPFCAGFDGICL